MHYIQAIWFQHHYNEIGGSIAFYLPLYGHLQNHWFVFFTIFEKKSYKHFKFMV